MLDWKIISRILDNKNNPYCSPTMHKYILSFWPIELAEQKLAPSLLLIPPFLSLHRQHWWRSIILHEKHWSASILSKTGRFHVEVDHSLFVEILSYLNREAMQSPFSPLQRTSLKVFLLSVIENNYITFISWALNCSCMLTQQPNCKKFKSFLMAKFSLLL